MSATHSLHASWKLLVALVSATGLLLVGASPAVAAPAHAPAAQGGLIYFVAASGGADQVFSMKSDGSARQQVTRNVTGTKKCDPVLSPAGNQPAYAANDEGMYVHNLTTGAVVNVAPGGADVGRSGGRRPAWSPNDNTLVFHYSQNWDGGAVDESVTTWDLWVTHRTDTGWTPAARLTHVAPGAKAQYPRFANGTGHDTLSYSYRPNTTTPFSLCVIDSLAAYEAAPAPGTAPAGRLLLSSGDGLLSTWSSNDTQIAFASACTGAVKVIDVTSASGSWQVSGTARTVAASNSCALSFSSSVPNLLAYAANGRIFVKNLTSTAKAVAIGSGTMPSW